VEPVDEVALAFDGHVDVRGAAFGAALAVDGLLRGALQGHGFRGECAERVPVPGAPGTGRVFLARGFAAEAPCGRGGVEEPEDRAVVESVEVVVGVGPAELGHAVGQVVEEPARRSACAHGVVQGVPLAVGDQQSGCRRGSGRRPRCSGRIVLQQCRVLAHDRFDVRPVPRGRTASGTATPASRTEEDGQ
jgi:hypothetical protein